MPITDTNVIDGPNVQADGQHRGTLEFVFDDGRTFTRSVRAPDAPSWANLIVDLPAQVEASVQIQDAEEDISSDAEIEANKDASIEQRAVAYLRNAWQTERADQAYLLFDKFNDFRLAKGWTLNQVEAGLKSAGLTAEEWAKMKQAYQYLNGGGRPAIMLTAQQIQDTWESR